MSEKRRKPDLSIIAGIAALVLLVTALAVYVGGYYVLQKNCGCLNKDIYLRIYSHEAISTAYWPAARVESLFTGWRVICCS